MREKIATIISFGFDPTITIPLFFAILFSSANLNPNSLRISLPLIMFIDIFLPGGLFFISLREGWVSDWELTKRQQRTHLYLIISLFWLLGTVISFVFGNNLLFRYHLIFSIAFLIATIITMFWKISIHMVIDTTVLVLVDSLLGEIWFLYLLLPIIAWSRYVRHKHTPTQLLGGFLLSILVVSLGFFLLGSG